MRRRRALSRIASKTPGTTPIIRSDAIRSSGETMWKGELVFISEALIGELVGIAELETGDYVVRFLRPGHRF